jgi:hypothetical protein
MWLCDLEKAIKDMREFFPDGCVFEKIIPAGRGIRFLLSDWSVIYWYNDGQIIRVKEDGTEIILRNFP